MSDILSELNKKELSEANEPAINKPTEEQKSSSPEPEVDATKEPHLKEENKLPPANELEQEEEVPEQRKIAGEAPYVTAARPDAFTKEVEGGVAKEKEGVVTGDRKSEDNKSSTTSTPVITP